MRGKPAPASQGASYRDTVFGAFFLALGGIDLYRGDWYFGVGFIALGLGLIVGSEQAHLLAHMNGEAKGTPLKVASYVLGIVALVLFGLQLWVHLKQ